MNMKIACPHCGQHYEIGKEYIGVEIVCDTCGKDFLIVEPRTEEPSIPLKQSAPAVHTVPPLPSQMMECPFCAGEIRVNVKKCRYCGEWLDFDDRPKNQVVYVILGLFFGLFGVHHYYVGSNGLGGFACVITVLFLIALPFTFATSGATIWWLAIFSGWYLINLIVLIPCLSSCDVACAQKSPILKKAQSSPHQKREA